MLPAAAIAVYLAVGSPAAINRSPEIEAAAPHGAVELAAAADRIKAHLVEAPGDLKGWVLLARTLASLARMPWQPRRPAGPIMTPGQVRAGFRHVRATLGTPASDAKPSAPGPGRPKGSKNKHKAPRHPVGKTHPKPSSRHVRTRNKTKQTG